MFAIKSLRLVSRITDRNLDGVTYRPPTIPALAVQRIGLILHIQSSGGEHVINLQTSHRVSLGMGVAKANLVALGFFARRQQVTGNA